MVLLRIDFWQSIQLSSYHILGTVLGTGGAVTNKTHHGDYIQEDEIRHIKK